ncbi:MAG: SpoIID/LytB domain-containing protein [Myxococcaceae bacterium]
MELPRGGRVGVGTGARSYPDALVIRAGDGELTIDELASVESYVAAASSAEADSLPPEALKAQAIVSRSWALANRGRHAEAGYDLCDLTHCQLYRGDQQLSSNAVAAAKATAGLVLVSRDGGVLDAPFHSSCGGATSNASDIFGAGAGEVRGVSDLDAQGKPLCSDAKDFSWTWEVSGGELAEAMNGRSPGDDERERMGDDEAQGTTRITRRDAAGRAIELYVLGKRTSGRELMSRVQKAFGYQSLRSLKFSLTLVKDRIQFQGHGVGHGVGFCQAGAAGMAKQGARYDEILRHYFPESVVRGVRK